MARTVGDFETIIDNAIASKPELFNMNSVSETAIKNLLRTVVAETAVILDTSFDNHKAEVLDTIAKNKVLRLDWYRKKALEFQYGDALTIIDNVIQYAVTDTSKCIVTRAAAVTGPNGEVKIKVAKGVPGALAKLDASELAALQAYFDIIQGAGDRVEVVSLDGDTLLITGTYYYDPLITLATAQANFLQAVNDFLSSADFNGELRVTEAEDAIQGAEGYQDLDLSFSCKAAADPDYLAVARSYISSSGYIDLDAALVASIGTYITFKPLADVPN